MKRKLTAVLLCVALLLTLSVNVSAEIQNPLAPQPTIQANNENSVTPRAETTSIVNNGVYLIKNVASGKYLNLHYGNDADGTNIYQWTKDGSTEQKWRISYNYATQAYQIYSMSSSGGKNRVLDVYDTGGSLVSGSNVKLHTPTEPASQEIDFILVASGKYKIVMKNNMNMCLSSYGTSNGTSGGTTSTSAGNVFISTYTGSDNQKWMFEYTGTKVTVAPGGWIDSVSNTAISGWAWRSDLKNSPISVSFDIVDNDTGETYYKSCIANVYRQDLYNAGYGNGYHGFTCAIDWRMFPSGNYTIRAYVAIDGTTYNLSGSPKTYYNALSHGSITLYGIHFADTDKRDDYYTDDVEQAISNIFVTATNGIFAGTTATSALYRMKNSMIWIVHTHGSKTAVQFNNYEGQFSYIRYDDISALEDDELDGERCVIYGTCNAGEGGEGEENMVNITHQKGAMTVIGWQEETSVDQMNAWIENFLVCSGDGGTIGESMGAGIVEVLYNFDSLGGLDKVYSRGSLTQRLID